MTTAAAAHQFDPEIAAPLAPAACAAGAPVIDRGDRRIAGGLTSHLCTAWHRQFRVRV